MMCRLQGKMIELIFSMVSMACNFCCYVAPYRYVCVKINGMKRLGFVFYSESGKELLF